MTQHLPVVYPVASALAVFAYVLADGWSLGIGILLPLVARPTDRDALLDNLHPGKPWWVFGGVILLVAVPLADSTLPLRLDLPIIAMLICLVLRATCYDLRDRAGRPLRRVCATGLSGGSLGAAFAQGWLLGAGLSAGRSILPLLCGAGLIGGYALLGAGWLILKADGAIQTTAREVCRPALGLSLCMLSALTGSFPRYVPVRFASVGLVATVPVILLYLALGYRVFRAKIAPAARSSSHQPPIASCRTSGAESSLHLS